MFIFFIFFTILILILVFFFIKNNKKEEDLMNKYSKDCTKELVIKKVLDKYKACENKNCTHCSILADINDEYILPTVHPNIVNEEDVKYMLNKSENYFKDSVTVGGVDKNIRKSQTAWLDKYDPVVQKIILKVCNLTNTPFENAENLQVVKYEKDGFYNEHFDSVSSNCVSSKKFLNDGGHRIVTMLIYLNDDFEEGSTRFVTLGKDIKPPKYSGILFYTLNKNMNNVHPNSLHAGLPIKSGFKYIANVWLRKSEFPYNFKRDQHLLAL